MFNFCNNIGIVPVTPILKLRRSYRLMLAGFRTNRSRRLFVCSGFWLDRRCRASPPNGQGTSTSVPWGRGTTRVSNWSYLVSVWVCALVCVGVCACAKTVCQFIDSWPKNMYVWPQILKFKDFLLFSVSIWYLWFFSCSSEDVILLTDQIIWRFSEYIVCICITVCLTLRHIWLGLLGRKRASSEQEESE